MRDNARTRQCAPCCAQPAVCRERDPMLRRKLLLAEQRSSTRDGPNHSTSPPLLAFSPIRGRALKKTLTAALLLASCTIPLRLISAQATSIPTRAEEDPSGWASKSDADLWKAISSRKSLAIVGLRSPGAPRGTWHGRLLISRAELDSGMHILATMRDVSLLRTDTLVAAVVVKISTFDAFQRIRTLPFVDYVEPAYIKRLGVGELFDCGTVMPVAKDVVPVVRTIRRAE